MAVALFGQLLTGTGAAEPARTPAPHAIDWQPCPDAETDLGTFECGTVKVPLDWSRPRGATVDVAVARHLADDPKKRIGSLVFNPGGPGGSGVAWAMAPWVFSSELTSRFDIVGFDPRGVRGSKPTVKCDRDLIDKQRALSYPKNAADFAGLRDINKAVADSCRALTGPLVDHMDTLSVVRDMDAVRAGLGEEQISYFGTSYGTGIGQQYAEMFPHRIRAMVLDSSMDHSLDPWSYQKTGAVDMEGAFGQFADWCERTKSCALYGRDVRGYVDALYKRAEAGDLEMPGEPPKPYTGADLQDLLVGAMSSPADSWSGLADNLNAFENGGSDTTIEAPPLQGQAHSDAYLPVMCQDYYRDLPSYAVLADFEKRLARIAPVTRLNGVEWTDLTNCQNWPTEVTNPPHPLRIHGTPKILVTNSRYDVSTPYSWASNVARQMGSSAVLLTYDGVGHGVYWLSPCGADAIDMYLTTLRTPAEGTHCPAIWPTGVTRKQATSDGPANPLPRPLNQSAHH
ncbi:alpha/beta hydrolase [Streptomyces sp. NPDC002324]